MNSEQACHEDEAIQKVWQQSHQVGSPHYSLRRHFIQKLIPESGAGQLVLDAGCSTGGLTRMLLSRGFQVDAIDLSAYAVKQVEAMLSPEERSNFTGIVGDMMRFVPEKRYDLVVLSEVLEHLEDDLGLLKKVTGWLKPDGLIVVTVPADPFLFSDADRYSKHLRRYTSDGFFGLIKEAGFKCKKSWGYGFPVLWSYTFLRNGIMRKKQLEQFGQMDQPADKLLLRTIMRGITMVAHLDRLFLNRGRAVGYMALLSRR